MAGQKKKSKKAQKFRQLQKTVDNSKNNKKKHKDESSSSEEEADNNNKKNNNKQDAKDQQDLKSKKKTQQDKKAERKEKKKHAKEMELNDKGLPPPPSMTKKWNIDSDGSLSMVKGLYNLGNTCFFNSGKCNICVWRSHKADCFVLVFAWCCVWFFVNNFTT